MRSLVAAIALAVTVAAPGAASACGDKLSALAGGVRYERLHRSSYPSRIVFYVPAASGLRSGADPQRLAADLQRAGHQVEIVSSADALATRLRAGGVDLVLSDDGAFDASFAAGTPVLGVRLEGQSAGPAANPACVATLGRRGGRQLVRSVEQLLEYKIRDGAAPCATPGGVRGT